MKKPTFLILGAQKAGTSALSTMLSQHPLIEMAKGRNELKEIHYFDAELNYAKGLDWYSCQFEAKPGSIERGEATPNYMYYEKAIARIANDLPDARHILILRHPVARALSQINMLRNKDGHSIDILSLDSNHEIIARGLYSRQIDRLYNLIDPARILVLFYDDLVTDYIGVMNRICTFLELPLFKFENKKIFVGHDVRSAWVPKTIRVATGIYKASFHKVLSEQAQKKVHIAGKKTKAILYSLNVSKQKSSAPSPVEKEHLEWLFRAEIDCMKASFPALKGRWT